MATQGRCSRRLSRFVANDSRLAVTENHMSNAVTAGSQGIGPRPASAGPRQRTQLLRRCRPSCLTNGAAVCPDIVHRHVAALSRIYRGEVPHDRVHPTGTRLFQRQVSIMGRVRGIKTFLHGPAAMRGGGIRRRRSRSCHRPTRTGCDGLRGLCGGLLGLCRLRQDWASQQDQRSSKHRQTHFELPQATRIKPRQLGARLPRRHPCRGC